MSKGTQTLFENYIAGENLTVEDLVYLSDDRTVMKAKADSSSTMPCIGMALESASQNDSISILLQGAFENLTNNVFSAENVKLYVSEDTAGAISESAPTAGIEQQIGISTTTDGMILSSITKPQGETGLQGLTGIQGETGIIGETGAQGYTGMEPSDQFNWTLGFLSSPSAGDLAQMEGIVPRACTASKLKVAVYGSASDYCNIKVFKRPLSSGSIQNDANSTLIADAYTMNSNSNLVGDETSTYIGKVYEFTSGFDSTSLSEGEILYAEADAVSGTVDKCVVLLTAQP